MSRATVTILGGIAVLFMTTLLATVPADGQKAAEDPPAGKVITNSVGMKLAAIPAGKFQMGSPREEAERHDEEVQHEVTISRPFYMGVHEVSQRDFDKVMDPMVRRGSIFRENRGGGPDNPVENITWGQALTFCESLSARPDEKNAGRRYRLPTEAEWEYACRAGTTTAFNLGNDLSSKQANFNGQFPHGKAEKGEYLRRTAKVGSYPPNAWGLYDMHGNVGEWCADFYDQDYYGKSPKADPTGPEKGVLATDYGDFYRVVRGGNWLDEGRACRSASRWRAMPKEPYRLIGFRVVCVVETPKP